MSEYADAHSVSRLIGAPPGYVGHDEQGQLTNALRARPYSLVLLDEVEKAHPQIFDIFLQVFGSGRLTDGRGESVDCRQAMFVMTSNLGSEAYWNDNHFGLRAPDLSDDEGRGQRDQAVMDEIKKYFRPEFLNRIDRAICFDPISRETMRSILDTMIDELLLKLEARDIWLEIPPDVRSLLVKQSSSKQGVPALARKLREEITNQAIARLVESPLDQAIKLVAKIEDDKVVLDTAT
jgi:ATP-dependent Clp protease ATP-binding subunit ClpC